VGCRPCQAPMAKAIGRAESIGTDYRVRSHRVRSLAWPLSPRIPNDPRNNRPLSQLTRPAAGSATNPPRTKRSAQQSVKSRVDIRPGGAVFLGYPDGTQWSAAPAHPGGRSSDRQLQVARGQARRVAGQRCAVSLCPRAMDRAAASARAPSRPAPQENRVFGVLVGNGIGLRSCFG
jgi:hypothetical protein